MKSLYKIYLGLILSLIVIGLLIIYNASGYSAVKDSLAFEHFFNKHLVKVLLGLLLLVLFSVIPYKYYKEWSKPALIFTVLLLIATMLVAPKVKGATRWINLGFIRFQPSELAKLVLIIHLSNLLVVKENKILSLKEGLLYLLFWVFLVAGLVFLQPNVSTSIIIIVTSFALLYVGGASFKHLVSIGIPVFFFGGILAMVFHHSRNRLIWFYQSISQGKTIPQVLQAKIALGSGGWFGVGLGHSHQSYGFVPEAYKDFIFSILGEELGFLGSVTVLLAYFALFFVGILIARKVTDKFAQLLVFGLSFSLLLGGFTNIAVVIGAAPTTGITLPFISYGGTSLIIGCISAGIVINIARTGIKEARI